jgi:hypothetical protein
LRYRAVAASGDPLRAASICKDGEIRYQPDLGPVFS